MSGAPKAGMATFGDVPENSKSRDPPEAPVLLIADHAMTSLETDPWKTILFSQGVLLWLLVNFPAGKQSKVSTQSNGKT